MTMLPHLSVRHTKLPRASGPRHPRREREQVHCPHTRELGSAAPSCETDPAFCPQHRHSRRELGDRAFMHATGQRLPALVRVRAPDATELQMALLEVFPDDSDSDVATWRAGGYLWQPDGATALEWCVVNLEDVQFEEPFVCPAPRWQACIARAWRGLRRWWLRAAGTRSALRESSAIPPARLTPNDAQAETALP